MKKRADRQESGYYEIRRENSEREHLPVSIITGNVIYNALHWHDHLEMIYCIHGSFCLRVEEQVFHMGAGDFLLVNGRDSHEIFDGEKDGLQIIASISPESLRNPGQRYLCQTVGAGAMDKADERAVHLRKLLGKLAYDMTPNLPGEMMMSSEKNMTMTDRRRLAEKVYENLLDSDCDWYGYLACCYQLLQVLSNFWSQEKKVAGRDKNEDFRRCISYIHEHYQEELGIETLARVMNVSEPGVYRMFQNKLSVTPTTYIHIIRIRMACALLNHPERKVADVAFECGFSSLSNFYRTFEKHMKMSPREYRKRTADTFELPFSEISYQSIMDANVFQNFFELPYEREVFLEFDGGMPGGV